MNRHQLHARGLKHSGRLKILNTSLALTALGSIQKFSHLKRPLGLHFITELNKFPQVSFSLSSGSIP
jgi:hypothetical protein